MPIQKVINKGRVPVKIYTDEIEHEALQQLLNIARLPFVHSHVAAMPDVHYGIGATVGSVIPCKSAIIPAAVGVDIGCGMNAVRLSLSAEQLPDSLRKVRGSIENAVPVGFEMHKSTRLDWSSDVCSSDLVCSARRSRLCSTRDENGLSRTSLAPRSHAAWRETCESSAEMTITRVRSSCGRRPIQRSTSMPLIRGMMTSSRTKSYLRDASRSSAMTPSSAVSQVG